MVLAQCQARGNGSFGGRYDFSVREQEVCLERRQQLLERGGVGRIAIDWTVAFHSLPDSSYMIQLGRGHCDLFSGA
jgi:hypothetical protein